MVDLATRAGIAGYLYPVGRLDYDSEGLIILTNDGEFAERVLHPRYELERTYEAEVEGVPDERDLERLRRGVEIDGRRTAARAGEAAWRDAHAATASAARLEIVLREGRNRQVRYMCDAIAHPVARLKRTRIGTITAKGVAAGRAARPDRRERSGR